MTLTWTAFRSDPHYFCNQLLERSLGVVDAETQLRDRELVAHARLCALLQKIQMIRASPEWTALPSHASDQPSLFDDIRSSVLCDADPLPGPAQTLVAAYDEWTNDLDNWALDNDIPSASPPGLPPANMSLALFRLFARNYLNFAASKEAALAADSVRWRFRAASATAAREMLEFVAGEAVAEAINLVLPFYVKVRGFAPCDVSGLLHRLTCKTPGRR